MCMFFFLLHFCFFVDMAGREIMEYPRTFFFFLPVVLLIYHIFFSFLFVDQIYFPS